MKLSIVVPCYNEEKVIQTSNERLQNLITKWIKSGLITDYEIIYIDDGSQDSSLKLLKEFTKSSSNIKVIALSNNFGQQAALTAGLLHSSGDATVSIDADLQDPPEAIEDMLYEFKSGSDIVLGVRKSRQKDTFLKRFTAEAFYNLIRSMGVDCVYNHADFRLLSKRVLVEFKKYHEVNRFLRGIIPLLGFNRSIVKYDREKRYAGKTKYPFKKMLSFAIEGITSFSSIPLRAAFVLGFLIFLVTLCLSFWALLVTFLHYTVPRWVSTVLPIYFLGGIQLMFLGVIGEYIGKIYMEVKHRPLYIIKEKFNFED